MAATAAGSGVPPPDYYAPTAPMSKIGLGGSQQVTFGMQGTQQPGEGFSHCSMGLGVLWCICDPIVDFICLFTYLLQSLYFTVAHLKSVIISMKLLTVSL